MSERYTSPLALTSQFFFCGVPLRLDSYRGCGFQCGFCFARSRMGLGVVEQIRPGSPDYLAGKLRRSLYSDEPLGLVGQFLRKRTPIHFGGMSDPFQPAEKTY